MKNYRYIERRNQLIRTIAIWVAAILGPVLLSWLLVHFCFQAVTVHGNSMQTTYYDGDLVLVNKIEYTLHAPERYDAAVFELENGSSVHYALKRIVALPGEKIRITEGKLYVNDIEQDYFDDNIMSAGLAAYEMTLGEDEYFVMGDNYNNSEDSRVANIGNIKKEQFVGKASIVIHKGKR